MVNPIALREDEISASEGTIDYCTMTQGLRHMSEAADIVVVEGTGGWRTVMNDLRPYSEWVVQEQLPVVLVVGIKLGCISHALLTAQAIINDGLPLVGWVANRINRSGELRRNHSRSAEKNSGTATGRVALLTACRTAGSLALYRSFRRQQLISVVFYSRCSAGINFLRHATCYTHRQFFFLS